MTTTVRPRVLTVLIQGVVAGSLAQDPQLAFTYDADYLADSDSTPLSISMPLAVGSYRQSRILPWIDGLLPDNQEVRDRWARQFQVSARNPFALLAHMGRESAGAVQLCPPDEVDDVVGQAGHLSPVTEAEIGRRLSRLTENPSSWTVEGERWSLGGAQAKFALTQTGHSWNEAFGSLPTTHIIKPGIGRFRSQSLNEHFVMVTAAGLGLHTATTEYHEFDGRPAMGPRAGRPDPRPTQQGRRRHAVDRPRGRRSPARSGGDPPVCLGLHSDLTRIPAEATSNPTHDAAAWQGFFSDRGLTRADDGNRTRMTSLEGWGSTIELHPRADHHSGTVRRSPIRGCG